MRQKERCRRHSVRNRYPSNAAVRQPVRRTDVAVPVRVAQRAPVPARDFTPAAGTVPCLVPANPTAAAASTLRERASAPARPPAHHAGAAVSETVRARRPATYPTLRGRLTAPLTSGDCESGERARERGAAAQHACALPMPTPGQEEPGRADAPRRRPRSAPLGSGIRRRVAPCDGNSGAEAAEGAAEPPLPPVTSAPQDLREVSAVMPVPRLPARPRAAERGLAAATARCASARGRRGRRSRTA